MDMIKVLVVNDDPEEREAIGEAFLNIEYISLAAEVETADEAMEEIEKTDPAVVIVGAYVSGDGLGLASKIARSYPEKSVIILERELREENMRRAIFAGARDVLIYPFDPAKLVDSVYRCYQVAQERRAEQQRERKARKKLGPSQGQVLTVFSTKGGVGKTFLATNLAVSLARQTGGRVALVDLDLDFGNAALAMNVIPRYTIFSLVDDIRYLDQDLLEGYLISHDSGVKLLPANAQPQPAEFISADHIKEILRLMQSSFDYIVLDMPDRFYDPADPVFHMADQLFLVVTPEVAAVRNVKACLLAFHEANFPKDKIKLVLNKAEMGGEIKPRDVETTLSYKLYSVLPAEHKLVASSLNKGIPLVQMSPRHKVSRGIMEMARRISSGSIVHEKEGL